jgi:hypothetical protein
MNAIRHIELLLRHKRIVGIGAVIGVVLAVLALYKPTLSGGPGLTPRTPPTYAAESKLIVTQEGFPWGRGALPGVNTGEVDENGQPVASKDQTRFVDPGRFAYLAWIYSHFLTGDAVMKMLPHHPPGMEILANPILTGGNNSADALPLIFLKTSAHGALEAQRLNAEAINALETYITENQNSGKVPAGERVELQVVNRSLSPLLVKGTSYSTGLAALFVALAGAIGLAFLLERLRDRSSQLEAEELVAEQFEDPRVSRLERTIG